MDKAVKKNLIAAEHLSFSYSVDEEDVPVVALDDVSFEIEEGSFVAIVGRNGSGKSTLAKNMNALLLPSGGRMLIDGMDTADENCVWEIRKTVGMVFQNPDNQLVSSIVEDDVAFGPENLGIEPSEIRRRVDEALNAVSMYEHRKKGPHLLSGGQKQRIAIAGVLAMQPKCIVFDEPTAMLDPKGRKEILQIIEDLHKAGHTIVLITHFMEEAAKADRIIVMEKAGIAFDGTPEEVFESEEKLKEFYLDIPFAASMARALRKKGLAVPEGIVSEEALIDYLCSLN